MRLVDVNVLVNANRRDATRHEEVRRWLLGLINGEEPYAVSDEVINGYLRLVTDRRIFREPTPLREALDFADLVRNQEHARVVVPGERHWQIFTRLCGDVKASGKLIPDAYLAALAIEHGCEFISSDRDFSKFPGLRWQRPLEN